MSIEAWKLAEEEKKKKEKSEKEKKQEMQKILEQERIKKEAREKKENTDVLKRLEEMLEDWELSQDEIKELKQMVENVDISEDQVEEILEKIEEIENMEDIDKYLPKEFRITAEEYKKSLTDDVVRLKTLTKLNTATTILAQQLNPDSSMWMNLFSWYMIILDKKLIKIQENTIDVKQSLQKIEDKKNPPKKKTFWEMIKDFFREMMKG